MNRRDVLKELGLAAGAFLLPVRRFRRVPPAPRPSESAAPAIPCEVLDRIQDEPAAASEVRVENGAPRLRLNGKPVFPIWGMSAGLLDTTKGYHESGIDFLSVILGLSSAWSGPERYDWSELDRYLGRLLALNPDAFFLPRLQLNAPRWWEDAHRDELVQYGLAVPEREHRMEARLSEGGFDWHAGLDAYDPSLASKVWIADASDLLRSYLRHVEGSPLRSRIMGYHLSSAMTSEWHYIGSRYLPDYSGPMKRKLGPIPSPSARMKTTFGLLRDPEKERKVIEFYRKFHANTADVLLHFARIVKDETERRVVCGTFYAYILENVMIQEAGHLAPESVLTSPDIDFIASPYTYQHTNVAGRGRWESDVVDGAGNWLGRARGEAGDGGYRVPVESVKRHGKLFIVEWDPSTYLEPVKRTEGGSGSRTLAGTLHILERDLGRMIASGIGGWFLDFGHFCPPFGAKRGWYDDAPMIAEIRRFTELGNRFARLNAESVAEIACVLDADCFFATQHWKAEKPWKGFGIAITDFINHWFVNSQARSFHRIGAPLDFLFRFDLGPDDASRYRLFFMVNVYYLTDDEVARLKRLFRDSGATVVWSYAPGFLAPDRMDLGRMEDLTGFRFKVLEKPGPMTIRTTIRTDAKELESTFGVQANRHPRFAVTDEDARVLGRWSDGDEVAFASKRHDGYRSVYAGTAPLPVHILRWLAETARVPLWCDKPDVVTATRGVTCLVATSEGKRTLRFPTPQRMVFDRVSGEKVRQRVLDLKFGDVRMFVDAE